MVYSYLSNRKQIGEIKDIVSEAKSITYGVPQCSVLWPVLFLLYINKVCDLNINGKIVTYTDDTCLLFSDNTFKRYLQKSTKGINLT